MTKRIITLASALLVLTGAVAVQADLWPPVSVTVTDGALLAEPGQPLEVHLELTSDVPVTVSGFRIEGQGWQSVAIDAPAEKTLGKLDRLAITATVLTDDPDRPVEFVFEIDGRTWRQSFDFSPRHYEMVTSPQPEVTVPSTPPAPGVDIDLPRPKPPVDLQPGRRDGDRPEPEEDGGQAKRSIRIHGRFVYERSDGVTIGADGVWVRIYDEDVFVDDLLASGTTDAYGYYDFTIDTSDAGETNPDLYVRFDANNSEVTVKDASSGNVYAWQSATYDNYGGSDWDRGWTQPADEAQHPALHILTDLTRDWRWDIGTVGYDEPHIDAHWPDGATGAWYNSSGIHISTERQWREDTHAHEYGHHWMNSFSTIPPFDYCNGICDNSPTDCGHCIWCQEDGGAAWSEGFANWCADVKTRSYAGTYGIASQFFRSQENLSTCGASYDDPTITEGFLGALLRDIEDGTQDSHGVYGSWTDALALGYDEIYVVADYDTPVSPMDFLDNFKTRYPSYREDLWETARNCGYEIDTAIPAAPTNLTSPSHSTTGDSPDPTIDFTWTRAYDDASGVAGYGIYISGSPGMPSSIQDIGDVTSYTTDPLPPGTYFFNIRTVDRSGKWGSTYASHGPITIREAEPADLVFYQAPLWDRPLVPRNATGATYNETHVTPTLTGDASATYWNMRGQNVGESTTSTGFAAHLYVDGVYSYWASWGPIGPSGHFYGIDMGPFYVHAGRHTFSAMVDAGEAISELDETNNVTGHQYIWTPGMLTPDSRLVRVSPPDRVGGWSHVVDGQVLWYNSDGKRFSSSAWWNAVVVYATDLTKDFDVRLYPASTGSEDGFGANSGWSSRGAGLIDAVFVNRNTQGIQDWDVGTINFSDGPSTYAITHRTNSTFLFGDSTTVSFAQDEMLKLLEFYVSTADTGYVSTVVDVDPAQGPVTVLWLDKSFTTGDLYDYTDMAVSDASGRARIDNHVGESGYYCVVVYRDPVDGMGPLDVTMEIQPTPPDFLAYHAAGWHAPLVPRPADDGTPASVALPDTLYGNIASTYLNIAVRNESPTTYAGLHAGVYIDGVYSVSLGYGTFPGYVNSLFNWDYAMTIRGGRHTMVLRIDELDEVEEIHEDNNVYGEQYLWSPLIVPLNTQVSRAAPPDRTAGWTDITSGEPLWYNCDGLRTERESWWQAIAVMPSAPGDDVDVRLHDALSGTKDGFAGYHAISSWGAGQSDFVLVNYNISPFVPYDAGVLAWSSANSYTADVVGSAYYGYAGGSYGPFTLAENRILHLHEFWFPVGFYTISLHNLAGDVDWGLSLHTYDATWMGKSTTVPGGVAWLNGPAQDEHMTIEITDAGYYCLSVWKKGSADLAKSGDYDLRIGTGMTDADDLPQTAATRLVSVHPNPFNPRTRIAFELARETETRLGIYDLRGSLVRNLVSGHLAAGRHEAVWDGTDSSGQRAPSGVYMVRLSADGVREMRKVMLVK